MTIIWDIDTLERDPVTGRVTVAHWLAARTDGTHSASTFGAVDLLPTPEGAGFMPFNQLTKEVVLEWVIAALSVPPSPPAGALHAGPSAFTQISEALDASIEAQRGPRVVAGTPW